MTPSSVAMIGVQASARNSLAAPLKAEEIAY